jgi:uncharacterized protein (DUF433 family)
MNLVLKPDYLPLRQDLSGTIRIGQSRVTLDVVAQCFEGGHTPEMIVEQFPTLSLADVYLVVGYYLQNHSEMQQYLAEGQRIADEAKKKTEDRFNPVGLREQLLKRSRQG